MDENAYALKDPSALVSPALIYYPDIILANTKRAVEMAGGAERLWPHVKSHKTAELIRMQGELGITRFKCATIAEAEMCAAAGGRHIVLAYPLVGPNVARFLGLAGHYTDCLFYATGDDYGQLALLSEAAVKAGTRANVLVDVDVGMHRTGVPPNRLGEFYESLAALEGIAPRGLHCYDGHLHDRDFKARKAKVDEIDREILGIRDSLVKRGFDCGIMLMGGTPTLPCRAEKPGLYLSPGTCFIGDWGYYTGLPDMAFTPGAALLARVVSRPGPETFTLDLGCKGIAADPPGQRGIIAGMEGAVPLFQNEEHWVFSAPAGVPLPAIGSACYVLPAHICPTSALYPEILIARKGQIEGAWQVRARNRRINY
ncbi:MAG: D-TA family PLP-dependent enzyme [Treponema sp.]|jgi:D-serine deaminase-like pyridoxal phosphate-dependent protein|nr:D-TA family PLP-dependent enzyme [Treponema sp.]